MRWPTYALEVVIACEYLDVVVCDGLRRRDAIAMRWSGAGGLGLLC